MPTPDEYDQFRDPLMERDNLTKDLRAKLSQIAEWRELHRKEFERSSQLADQIQSTLQT